MEPTIPLTYAVLILKFTHSQLTEAEHDELDRWIETSDENLEAFEQLTGSVEESIFDPNDIINETDSIFDLWMIAGLVARELEGIIGTDEKRTLQNWIEDSDQNAATYQLLLNKANLKKMIMSLRHFKGNHQPFADLN